MGEKKNTQGKVILKREEIWTGAQYWLQDEKYLFSLPILTFNTERCNLQPGSQPSVFPTGTALLTHG